LGDSGEKHNKDLSKHFSSIHIYKQRPTLDEHLTNPDNLSKEKKSGFSEEMAQ